MINERQNLVKIINHLPTSNQRGPRFRWWWLYNNQVCALVAHIIEEKSGQDYDAFLSERLLKPLGFVKPSGVGRRSKGMEIWRCHMHD
jgi:CubicO group peptidase (beta-lactamase class C family)